MTSDGYQTFNFQDRKAFSAKYQYAISPKRAITAFSSVVDLHSNTPDQKGSTRAQLQQFGNNFLMTDDPTSPLYYKFDFYHIPTHFEYTRDQADLGRGWSIDNKTYTMRYYNKQNFNSTDRDHRDERDRQTQQLLEGGATSFRSRTCRTVAYSAPGCGRNTRRPIAIRRRPIRARGSMPRCRTSTRCSSRRRCSRMRNTSCRLRRTAASRLASSSPTTNRTSRSLPTTARPSGTSMARRSSSTLSNITRWLPSIDAHYLVQSDWSVYGQYGKGRTFRRRASST